jgi:hypothetical protein
MVAVDDSFKNMDGVRSGKGMIVREFMDSVGKQLVHDEYQLVWKI